MSRTVSPDRETHVPRPTGARVRRPAWKSDEIQPEQTNVEAQDQKPVRHIPQILKDFCSSSTVHGLRYLTEPKCHWLGRVWWAIAVIASIVACGVITANTWRNWNEHPVIVSLDNKVTSIDKIPFPAVTICPTKKFFKQKVNIAKIQVTLSKASKGNQSAFTNLSPKVLSQINAILQTCSSPHSFPVNLDIPSSPSIYEIIKDIVRRKKSAIDHAIMWKFQTSYKLMEIFTADGLCYTFNSLNSHQIYADGIAPELLTVRDNPNATHWNREDGYQSNIDESDLYPYQTFVSDINFGLLVEFLTLVDDSHKFCSPFATGFHVSVHAPDELPQTRNNFIHIPHEQFILIVVTPNVVTTSNGLRSCDPHARGCYFQSEHQLRFFRSYSEQKCELECLTNFTKNECGCVHFSMPRVESTKVCTISDMECYRAAKHQFNKHHNIKQCDCLPDCTSISYSTEVSKAPFVYYLDEQWSEKQNFLFHRSGFPMESDFYVSFKKNHFILTNRSESSTMWDFLSSCGGLLGLFMGVSVLSIVEMIYYFTLRLWVNWRQQKKVQPIEQAEAEIEAETENEIISQNIVEDYCTNTTVHGLRYFTEPKRHRVERVWWAIAVFASVVCCGVIIQLIWTNWNENPVIVSFDDELTSIGEIPFPAVTVCSNKKFIMKNVDVVKLLKKCDQSASGDPTAEPMSPEEISQLDAIAQTSGILINCPSNFSIPSTTLIYDAIKNITLEQSSTIQSVNWLNRPNRFKFKPIFTSEALCYTFNSRNSHEIYSDVVEPELLTVRDNPNSTQWNRENGYQSNGNEINVYPHRVSDSDALSVRLGIVIDYLYETDSGRRSPGLYLSLHAPDELPPMENNIFIVPPEHDVYVSVRPETMATSDGLRGYSPHKRGCYFQSERKLHFFKSYSQHHCQLECLTNFTVKECGCAHFSFPREKNTRICTMLDAKNSNAALMQYRAELLVKQCDCLPDCTSIVYHTELSQAPYHHYDDAEVKKFKKSYKYPGYLAHSKLRISFKENRFISVNRSETSTMSDFLSSCGGLLGLFMGVSVLSIVELIYYFTLRLGVNVWRQKSDRIKAAAVRIKRACVAFARKQWEKLKTQFQWTKLKEEFKWTKLRERFRFQWRN